MNNSPVLRTEKLNAGYGDKIIAKDIEFSINPGEIVSLIGPNGSGKTTILKTVGGFNPAVSGEVYLGEKKLKDYSLSDKSKYMSVMMTERMSADLMTVRDMVSLGRFPYTDMLGRLSDEDKKIVDSALSKVGMTELEGHIYNDLSDGQKQRALLARAISQGPKLMLLDEPTSYLDIYHKIRFIDILKGLSKEEGISILMSVHELEIAYEISDRIVCLGSDGRLKAIGSPKEVFESGIISELYNLEPERLAKVYGGFSKWLK